MVQRSRQFSVVPDLAATGRPSCCEVAPKMLSGPKISSRASSSARIEVTW